MIRSGGEALSCGKGSPKETINLTEESTIKPDSSAGKWISYRVIYGIGIGLAFQTVLDDFTVPAGNSQPSATYPSTQLRVIPLSVI